MEYPKIFKVLSNFKWDNWLWNKDTIYTLHEADENGGLYNVRGTFQLIMLSDVDIKQLLTDKSIQILED